MEHLFAHHTGGMFKGHRGHAFHKVVHVTTNSQLSLGVKIPANSECELTVGDRAIPVISPVWRTLHIMWLNVAISNPGMPEETRMEVQQYLQQIVPHHMPDALLITSTGHGLNAALLPNIMQSIGFTIGYQNNVGLDGGVVCAAFQGQGAMWRNVERGNNIERGIVVEYNWF